jgi:hypothetical protein
MMSFVECHTRLARFVKLFSVRTSTMGGGLLQLVAFGAQDV